VVRRLIGYDRYNSRVALEALNHVYDLLRLYINFFQPVMKLVDQDQAWRQGTKVYDTARTPYQRLLEVGILTEVKQQELATTYYGLNPVSLLRQINENLERLWDMAERLAYQHGRAKTYGISVT